MLRFNFLQNLQSSDINVHATREYPPMKKGQTRIRKLGDPAWSAAMNKSMDNKMTQDEAALGKGAEYDRDRHHEN